MASTKPENDESTAREDEERPEEEESTATAEAEGEESESDDESSDDESSDDESSDDESSDDESSDDESAEEDEEARAAGGAADAEAVPEATPKKKKSGKGGPRVHKKDGMTAGARLAAAKAAKAARKAAKLGKEKKAQDPMAQVRESPLVQKVEKASSWAQQNRTMVWALVAAVVLGLGGFVGYRYYTDQQAQAAAVLLEDALEIADAQIVEETDEAADAADATDEESDEDEAPTFPTERARAEASLEAFRQVISQYPSSAAATWARLGEARALFELGQNEEARESYERAASEGGSDPAIVWRALEGRGFILEADEQWAEALQIYEELATVDERRFEPVAKYHMARMYLAQGERERATDTLRTLVESLREAEDDEEAQDFQYVLAQAQTRLRELDPSAAPPPPSPSLDSPFGEGAGGPGGDISPEQLQELIRRFQQQQQQQGAGGGGEE